MTKLATVTGSVYGDPHFTTFDGVTYTFNGRGEYTLMHINNDFAQMDVQGRFDQVMKNPFASTLLFSFMVKFKF